MEGVRVGLRPKLVLSGPHSGRHCTGEKVHACVFLLQGQGDSEVLVDV